MMTIQVDSDNQVLCEKAMMLTIALRNNEVNKTIQGMVREFYKHLFVKCPYVSKEEKKQLKHLPIVHFKRFIRKVPPLLGTTAELQECIHSTIRKSVLLKGCKESILQLKEAREEAELVRHAETFLNYSRHLVDSFPDPSEVLETYSESPNILESFCEAINRGLQEVKPLEQCLSLFREHCWRYRVSKNPLPTSERDPLSNFYQGCTETA